MRHSRSGLAAVVVAALAGLGLEARTGLAADIAGDWSLPGDVFLRCSRLGDVVTCQFLPTLLSLDGSCDAGTGAFSFPVPPVPPPPGSGSVPPGPEGSFAGTVALDGQSFDGTLTLCTWIGSSWSCAPIPMDGTRFDAAAAQCDNGLVEPSETCDQGSFEGVSLNGDTCCDASCQLVDPDGDLSCSRHDNCPDVTNLDQADTDFDGVGDACDPDQGAPDSLLIERVRVHYSDPTRATLSVKASYPGSADPPWLIHVDSVLCNGLVLSIHSRGTYQELYRNLVCKVRPGKSVCKSEVDGLRLLVKTRQRPGSDVRFDLVLKHADFCSPGAMPPVRLTLVHAGGSRTGAATRCEIRATATGNVYKTTCTP